MAGLLFPLLLLGVMYAFLILPQRRKQKAHAQLLASIQPGDEVMTSGGIYGGVTEVTGDDLYLEIAPDIEIKVAKRAIAERTFVAAAAPSSTPTADAIEPPEPAVADKDTKNKK
jgi:preprotein translocase subunit YajC